MGQGGVVRDQKIREKCVIKVKEFVEHELSWTLVILFSVLF